MPKKLKKVKGGKKVIKVWAVLYKGKPAKHYHGGGTMPAVFFKDSKEAARWSYKSEHLYKIVPAQISYSYPLKKPK